MILFLQAIQHPKDQTQILQATLPKISQYPYEILHKQEEEEERRKPFRHLYHRKV